MARYIKKQRRGYYTNIRIPEVLQPKYGGKKHLVKTLRTRDETVAEAEALRIKAQLMLEAEALNGSPAANTAILRETYRQSLETSRQTMEDYHPESRPGDPEDFPLQMELETLEDEARGRGWERGDPLPEDIEARWNAINDIQQELRGKAIKPRAKYEPSFAVVAQQWLDQWKAGRTKETNTEDQYNAIIRFFSSYWGDRSVREIRSKDAAEFVDQLRTLGGHYKSNPKVKEMSWKELVGAYGNAGDPLAPPTINRHINRLIVIWQWAKKRELASGDNPFEDLKLPVRRQERAEYVAWTMDQLKTLLAPPPKRKDLQDLILVGMYTAMRINEAASLTWGQIKKEGKVWYFEIEDAKTKAGRRQIPIHSKLKWLLKKTRRGEDHEQVWPGFNPEGPGKKPGADASRLFGAHKRGRGFKGKDWRWHAFHSFRTNVTTQIENAGVPINHWQDVFGHEKGFTTRTYSEGLTLERKREIIELIEYKGLTGMI